MREFQLEKIELLDWFGDRRLARDLNCRDDDHIYEAVQASIRLEQERGKTFTFLTVTNHGAQRINHTRCMIDFADCEEVINWQLYAMPCDPDYGGSVVAIVGMRIRLTRNLDKEAGFVNGAVAVIKHVLRKNVFVAETPTGRLLLVHPVSYDGHYFMPFVYAYAMTIRRAQGSTMDLLGLWFDHTYPPERGYGYVGASRVRHARDLFLVGKLRRTDWLPVGGDPRGEEQERRGDDSVTTKQDSDFASEDQGCSDLDSGDEDQGGSDSGEQSDEDQSELCPSHSGSDSGDASDPCPSDSDSESVEASDPCPSESAAASQPSPGTSSGEGI